MIVETTMVRAIIVAATMALEDRGTYNVMQGTGKNQFVVCKGDIDESVTYKKLILEIKDARKDSKSHQFDGLGETYICEMCKDAGCERCLLVCSNCKLVNWVPNSDMFPDITRCASCNQVLVITNPGVQCGLVPLVVPKDNIT